MGGLKAAEEQSGVDGVRHQQLNSWAMETVAARLAAGTLRMDYEERTVIQGADESDDAVVSQMVGKAGDVWLIHPWLIHR